MIFFAVLVAVAVLAWAPWRPFHDFSIFHMDYLEKSRRHQWKERLKLKVVKLLKIWKWHVLRGQVCAPTMQTSVNFRDFEELLISFSTNHSQTWQFS